MIIFDTGHSLRINETTFNTHTGEIMRERNNSLIPFCILRASETLEGEFLGAKVYSNGTIIGAMGKPLKFRKNMRRMNSGFDHTVILKGKEYRVHRILAHVFLGMPIRSKKHVNHIDKDTTNNNLWNLEVTTPKQNMRHRSKH